MASAATIPMRPAKTMPDFGAGVAGTGVGVVVIVDEPVVRAFVPASIKKPVAEGESGSHHSGTSNSAIPPPVIVD